MIETVRGFHGTTLQAAIAIQREGFRISRNEYDWLGDGMYFFQGSPSRAWEWANRRFGMNAAVIGALIKLESCLDLLDIRWPPVVAEAYNSFLVQLKQAGLPLPRQTTGAHRLDRQVLNYVIGILSDRGVTIKVVRAAFAEGAPVSPESAIFDHAHIQIAVRDLSTIEEIWLEERERGI